VAIDGALGADKALDESDERGIDIGVDGGEERIAFREQRRKEAITADSRSRISA
jgi:hypothetical protein